jgi:hypothetical protein
MKEILLNQGKIALVDDEDYDLILTRKWYFEGRYVKMTNKSRVGSESMYMHRFILPTKRGYDIDHINGDKLDNRKCNLRIATRSQNTYNRGKLSNNTSGYKGVCYDKSRSQFLASIGLNGKNKYIGRFNDAISAAKAYNEIALKLHGAYALLNEV